MTNRQIETSREIRLWITGIVGPVLLGGATIIAGDPELRDAVKVKVKAKVSDISAKLKRKGS